MPLRKWLGRKFPRTAMWLDRRRLASMERELETLKKQLPGLEARKMEAAGEGRVYGDAASVERHDLPAYQAAAEETRERIRQLQREIPKLRERLR